MKISTMKTIPDRIGMKSKTKKMTRSILMVRNDKVSKKSSRNETFKLSEEADETAKVEGGAEVGEGEAESPARGKKRKHEGGE